MGSIAKVLVDQGAKVTWLASTWSHQFKNKIANAGRYIVKEDYDIELLECGNYNRNISIGRILHHRKFGLKVTQFLASGSTKPDLVVCAYPIPSVAAAAAKYCSENAIPFALDIRDLWPDVLFDKLGKLESALAQPLLRRQISDVNYAIKHASLITAVSESYLSWAKLRDGKKIYNEDTQKNRFLYFPIGAEAIDMQDVSPAGELELLISKLSDKTIYSFLGSFGKSYNLEVIVSAAKYFSDKKITDIHFLIAGDGEQREFVEYSAKQLSNLSYCGWLDSQNTKAFLAISDVGLMPLQSLEGTFPNKPFQYMAAGLPIISSLAGEFADLVVNEKIGINFLQGKTTEFINAVEILRDPKVRQEMTENSLNLFRARFEQSVVYSKFGERLFELIQK
jgi:glycosyltransferase involved in cell wall biosynthesis